MRNWINVVEDVMPLEITTVNKLVKIDNAFLSAVQEYIEEYLGDWSEDYEDREVLLKALLAVIREIEDESLSPEGLHCHREEYRPLEDLDNMASVGSCWSWHQDGASTQQHDNAKNWHGRDYNELTKVLMWAVIRVDQVDWVQSLAKNLVLRGEREISVKDMEKIHIEDVFYTGRDHVIGGFKAMVYSSGEF